MTSKKEPSHIAACDSQVLIWALPWAMRAEKKKKTTPQDVPVMRRRAKYLLKFLADEDIRLYIPSIVVSELLAGVEPSKHTKILAEFESRFFCPPFDLRACHLAAKLFQFERGLQGHGSGLPEQQRSARNILKSDILIVASAKVAGVSLFYSHESKCRRLASEAGMEATDLPESSGDLFTDQEIDQEEERQV